MVLVIKKSFIVYPNLSLWILLIKSGKYILPPETLIEQLPAKLNYYLLKIKEEVHTTTINANTMADTSNRNLMTTYTKLNHVLTHHPKKT